MINTDATLVEKYRTTTQFEDALKIIRPAPERRAECERDVATALLEVEWAAKIKPVRTAAQNKKELRSWRTRSEGLSNLPGHFPRNTKYSEARIHGSQKRSNASSRKLNKPSIGPVNVSGRDHQGLPSRNEKCHLSRREMKAISASQSRAALSASVSRT